jgi:hypothetical protein
MGKNLVGKPEERGSLGIAKSKYKDNIKMEDKDWPAGCKGVDWI